MSVSKWCMTVFMFGWTIPNFAWDLIFKYFILKIQSSVMKLKIAQSDRSNSTWHNHFHHMAQLIGFLCISSQWARCSAFKYVASAYCSSCSALQKPSTFPSSTCIDLLWGDLCMLYGGYFIHMFSSSFSYMLTAACCGCIGSSKSRYLLCHSSSVADLFRQDQTP